MTDNGNSFAERCAVLLDTIGGAARACGRDPASIQLMAVSKMQDDAALDAALRVGQRLFGENRVQEALAHWQSPGQGEDGRTRREIYPDLGLHLIGPLQRNKAEAAVGLFDCIETLDRPELIEALARAMGKTGRRPGFMIQVNTGAEPQKAGVGPGGLADLLSLARAAGLNVIGLMCIPPENEPAGLHFALLAKLAARHGLPQLSMGMSGDFGKAIPLGATILRLGTALFGARGES